MKKIIIVIMFIFIGIITSQQKASAETYNYTSEYKNGGSKAGKEVEFTNVNGLPKAFYLIENGGTITLASLELANSTTIQQAKWNFTYRELYQGTWYTGSGNNSFYSITIYGSGITDVVWNINTLVFKTENLARQYLLTNNVTEDMVVTVPEGYVVGDDGKVININNAPTEKSDSIPTPTGVRIKFIYPKLFEPLESKLQLTWTKPVQDYNVEISLKYNYKVGTSTVTKIMPYIKHSNNVMSDIQEITRRMESDYMKFIHDNDSNTQGQTFANGKLNLKEIYIRYTKFEQSKIKYGNWVRVSLVTGGTLDDGKVENTYTEVEIDEDGNENVVDSDEYGKGVSKDNDGNTVDSKGFTSFVDYLKAFPQIIGATFTALMTLVASIGNFGTIFGTIFATMPPQFMAIIMAGLALMIVLGIIKFLKG